MKNYTGFEWICIDVATQYGLDKLRFEERIQWTMDHMNDLEDMAIEAEEQPLYVKAVMALRKAQNHIPTGHLVGVDGVCSGIQIMSAMTGCLAGATATGLVDPDRRADAYSDCTCEMQNILGSQFTVSRAKAKQALMTVCYGSKAKPKEIFGEDTPELQAFYEAVNIVAPGAYELLQVLLNSWKPYALSHEWTLPDGHFAFMPVMSKKSVRLNVDEIGSSFTYEFYENQGTEKGRANAANLVHSVDAMVLREMHRRCNYETLGLHRVDDALFHEIQRRNSGQPAVDTIQCAALQEQIGLWEQSKFVGTNVLELITYQNAHVLPDELLEILAKRVRAMLSTGSFPLVTIHDEFKAHPNNVNRVRYWYKEILAELAESDTLDFLLSQLFGEPVQFQKLSSNLADKIRNSNYALC